MIPSTPNVAHADGASATPGLPARPGPSRLSWLRALPLLPRHIARMMPWTTLVTGCLAGTIVLAIVAQIARNAHYPVGQGGVRLAFAPAIAALAFVPRAWFRPVTQATRLPTWVSPAGQIVLAAPVLAATCWVQLRIMAYATTTHAITSLGTSRPAAVYPLIAQLIGWSAVAVAVAACVDRSRYADLGGAIGAPVSLVAFAIAWYAPGTSRVLVQQPATAHNVAVAWYIITAVALILTCAAMRDRWHRYARKLRWRSSRHCSLA